MFKQKQTFKTPFGNCHNGLYTSQSGSGIRSNVVEIGNFTKALLTLPQTYKGEKHGVIKMPSGEYQRASFMGPKTHIVERERLGIQPRPSITDQESQAHDIRYTKAQSSGDIREADLKMIKVLKKAKEEKTDHPINIAQGLRGIQAKVMLEKMGVPQSTFTSFGQMKKLPPNDQRMLNNKLADLEQKGLGKEEYTEFDPETAKPCEALYRKLIKRKKKKKKFPERVKKAYRTAVKIEKAFKKDKVPNNVMKAINNMTF